MGSLALPASGVVYIDANAAIYSVERHPDYAPLLLPLWQAASSGTIEVVSSELILLETLILPLRSGDQALALDYERLFQQPQTRLIPITQSILRDAARLRASLVSLRTPDAIHAATAQQTGCAAFVTNDGGFRNVPGLPAQVLSELLKP